MKFGYDKDGNGIEYAIQYRTDSLADKKNKKGRFDRYVAVSKLKREQVYSIDHKRTVSEQELARMLILPTSEMKLLNIEIQMLKCIRDQKPTSLYVMYFSKAEEIRTALLESMEESVK